MTTASPTTHEPAGPSEPPRAVVEFHHLTLLPVSRRHDALNDVHLTIGEGQCVLVLSPPGHESLPLADAALGLVAPSAGSVSIMGDDWTALAAGEQLARRGRIGRVFQQEAWISNLNVLENVLLQRRHHTTLDDKRLLADAERWSRRFALEGVPTERPSLVPDRQLRLAEWVRAFSLEPSLLLLERPMRGVPRDRFADLCAAVAEVQARGGAVLWLASETDPEAGADPAGAGVSRYAVRNETLTPLEPAPP